MSEPVILTGLRANNELHIGNYLGALLPLVDMARQKADSYQINLFVPDLHSFTTPTDHGKLQAAIMQNLRVFAAAGLPLDHKNVHLYRQSHIPAHSELTWILDCFTGFGEMNRMTQLKDRMKFSQDELDQVDLLFMEFNMLASAQIRERLEGLGVKTDALQKLVGDAPTSAKGLSKEQHPLYQMAYDHYKKLKENSVTVGLFNYPVLMAADILLYDAEYVPIGDDQTQHLEFARDIAERINKKFERELFTIPKPVKEQHEFFGKDQGLRIRDLQNPGKKMSKSDESGKGVIFLTDSPEAARKKIMSAETDSMGQVEHSYELRPGVSNLLDILRFLGGEPREFMGQSQYGLLKKAVADRVSEFLTDFQAKLADVDDARILGKLENDEQKMREIANGRLLKVQQAVGLRP